MTAPPAGALETESSESLRVHIRRTAPDREAAIASFLASLYGAAAFVGLGLESHLGQAETRDLSLGLAVVAGYYFAVARAFRHGHYHPIFEWVDVAIENSVPAVLFIFALRVRGPEFALTGPPVTAWAVTVLVSALRMRRGLAIAAGLVATGVYLALYFGLALPRMQPPYLETLAPGFVLVRAFFILAAGALTAVIAQRLVREAEFSLRSAREQDVMGKYHLHERIGAGGMAEVHRATYRPEGGFAKQVAVKRISPGLSESPEFITLFRREAELGSLLSHPNIVQVLDFGRHRGQYFLVEEFVDGLSLSALLQSLDHPLPLSALTFLAVELGDALDYIHHRTAADGAPLQLVHRDVNPPNILLSRFGDVKLADFGIAKAASAAPLTEGGIIRGKIRFMAPEQILARPLDARADLFSLGLTLYLALTGRSAFHGCSDTELARAMLEASVEPPSRWREDAPAALDEALLKLLEREPDGRPQSGRELREMLCALQGEAAPFPRGRSDLGAEVEAGLGRLREAPAPSTGEARTASTPALGRWARTRG